MNESSNSSRHKPIQGGIPIALCADDYGLAPGVGHAIRDLIARGRLSATSCMTVSAHWPAEAALLPLRGRCDVGLHLTLTDQVPLGPMSRLAPEGRLPPLGRLIALALARRLDRAEIAAELERQLDRFEEAWGSPPDFLDGHHHVHQLPVVREAVLDLYDRRLRRRGVWVRYCDTPLAEVQKCSVATARAAVIALLGRGWRRLGTAAGVPGNAQFRGVRDFTETVSYATLLAKWLQGARPGLLIMCHPGLTDDALKAADTLTAQREEEYRTLAGEEWPALLATAGARLARPSAIIGRNADCA